MFSITHSETVDSISKASSLLYYALRMNTTATVIAGILYGFLTLLFFNCVTLLLRSKRLYSKRMRTFFAIYVTSMFLLSTGAMIQEIIILNQIFLDVTGRRSFRVTFSNLIPATTPFIIWGADGLLVRFKITFMSMYNNEFIFFMIHRCGVAWYYTKEHHGPAIWCLKSSFSFFLWHLLVSEYSEADIDSGRTDISNIQRLVLCIFLQITLEIRQWPWFSLSWRQRST